MLMTTRVRELLDRDGRTRKWLARECCASISLVRAWMCGVRQPRPAQIRLMAISFDVPESDLWNAEAIPEVKAG